MKGMEATAPQTSSTMKHKPFMQQIKLLMFMMVLTRGAVFHPPALVHGVRFHLVFHPHGGATTLGLVVLE